eukprot:1108271-Pyramimonas_sp.AAC.2
MGRPRRPERRGAAARSSSTAPIGSAPLGQPKSLGAIGRSATPLASSRRPETMTDGGGQHPRPDTSVGEMSVFGSREGATTAVFQACARQVWARGRCHETTFC